MIDPTHVARSIRQRLRTSAWLALRSLDCQPFGQAVTLAGEVPTDYTRQVALQVAREVVRGTAWETEQIRDRITVA